MDAEIAIPADDLLKVVRDLMAFPFPAICRHSVAADLLSILESRGYPLSDSLAGAVVECRDDDAIALIDELRKGGADGLPRRVEGDIPAMKTVARPNAGDCRLLRPVDCARCGWPIQNHTYYAVMRSGPGTFYYCVECGEEMNRAARSGRRSDPPPVQTPR